MKLIEYKIKKWYLMFLLKLSETALKYKDGADNQSEINEVIDIKNKVNASLRKLNQNKYN